jgi:hypothetical protein
MAEWVAFESREVHIEMSPEKFGLIPSCGSEKETTDTAPTAAATQAKEECAPSANSALLRPSANVETASNSPSEPIPQESATTSKPATPGKAVVLPKAIADATSTPSPPAASQPSMPVSMIVRPDLPAAGSGSPLFPSELEESFASALARVKLAQGSLSTRILRGLRDLIPLGERGRRESVDSQRTVAFDGFRNDLFEDKRERERRYGTVYIVSEEVNAFLVRLELPRQMPESSLKQTWELPNEMPDYIYTLDLRDNVLRIRAGLPDEARRRLSYVSSSFPSDFETRIEFDTPVERYKHRLRNKVLEILVFKEAVVGPTSRLRLQGLQD